MRKLSKVEKKIINLLNDEIGKEESKGKVMRVLRDYIGLDAKESSIMYRIWYYSIGEDLDEYVVPEEGELYTFVDTLSTMGSTDIDNLIDDFYNNKREYLDRIFGTYLSSNCGGWSFKTPCASFDGDGLTIELDRDEWEKYFSGLDSEDAWVYHIAFSTYSDWYEEVDDSEFEYVTYNDETLEYIEKIAILAGKNDWPGKDSRGINSEEINLFLSETLPTNLYDNIVNDYLSEMSMELTRVKRDAVRTEYEENIKYDTNETSCSSGDYCIHIPYDDLLDIIKDKDIDTLSDLKDVGVNPDVDLYNVLSETWLDDYGSEQVIKTLNNSLENVIEEISGNVDISELVEERRKVQEMLEKLDLKLISTTNNKGLWYKSNDGRLELFTNDINYEYKKIKFTYDGKSHMVPFDEFPNWVQGSVLDLNENTKIKKKILKEEKENIRKISIFDFDGTLMNTPEPSEGKTEWESKTNKSYPHIGWWSKPESLDTTIFNITPISSTIESYENEKDVPDTLVIMLTGRIPNLSKQVEVILSTNKLYFDEYHYKGDGDTLTSKINTIKSLLNRYPNVELIEMWEDREHHAKEFEKWGANNNINIKVNKVHKNDQTLIENRELRINKALDFILDNLLNDTRYYISKGSRRMSDYSEPVVVDVIYPMYGSYDIYYTIDEIKMWVDDPKWMLGSEDLDYFGDLYGLSKEETQRVLDKFLTIIAPKIYEEMENFDSSNWGSGYKSMSLTESVDKLIPKMRPPYIDFLFSAGMSLKESEKILSKLFDEKVYIEDDSVMAMTSLEVSEPTEFLVVSASENMVLYSENVNGDWKFYTKLVEGDVINENENKLEKFYEKISKIISPPYYMELEKIGLNDKEKTYVFSKLYNEPMTLNRKYDSSGNFDVEVINKDGLEYYFEGYDTDFWEMRKYDEEGNQIYFENSDGEKSYERINNNLNESIENDKVDKFIDKMATFIEPPYLYSLRSSGVPRQLWEKILSKIFKGNVVIDGVTADETHFMLTPLVSSDQDRYTNRGLHVYTEWSDFRFANYTDSYSSDTLDKYRRR